MIGSSRTTTLQRWLEASALVLAVGCDRAQLGQPEQPGQAAQPKEAVGETEQAVINGLPIASTDRLVQVNNARFVCTGTMITNDWVLSASHCAWDLVNPGNNVARLNGQVQVADRVVQHPSLDYALLHLSAPMQINGSFTGFKSAFYTGPSTGLVGQTLSIQGFGANACDGSGGGTLRWGAMAVDHVDGSLHLNYRPVNGQASGSGDSGGPTWKFFRNIPYQVGVIKAGDCSTFAIAGKPENFEQWAFEVIYNAPIHIPTTDSLGRGIWADYNVSDPDPNFWERPLVPGAFGHPAAFDPCPGSNNPYLWTASYELNGQDQIFLSPQSSPLTTLSGVGTSSAKGRGPLAISYFSPTGSPGMNWMTVQCNYGPQQAAVVCHGSRCETTRSPLPDNFSASAFWDPCGGGDFYYSIDYDFESWSDFVNVGTSQFTGLGSLTGIHSFGPVTVSVSTDSSVSSPGLRSLKAICNGW